MPHEETADTPSLHGLEPGLVPRTDYPTPEPLLHYFSCSCECLLAGACGWVCASLSSAGICVHPAQPTYHPHKPQHGVQWVSLPLFPH